MSKLNRRDFLLLVAAGVGTAAALETEQFGDGSGMALPISSGDVRGFGGVGKTTSTTGFNPVPSGEAVEVGCDDAVEIESPWDIDGTVRVCGTARVA